MSMGNRYPTFRPLNLRTLRCRATSGGRHSPDEWSLLCRPSQKVLTRAYFPKRSWQMSERARVLLLKFETVGEWNSKCNSISFVDLLFRPSSCKGRLYAYVKVRSPRQHKGGGGWKPVKITGARLF